MCTNRFLLLIAARKIVGVAMTALMKLSRYLVVIAVRSVGRGATSAAQAAPHAHWDRGSRSWVSRQVE